MAIWVIIALKILTSRKNHFAKQQELCKDCTGPQATSSSQVKRRSKISSSAHCIAFQRMYAYLQKFTRFSVSIIMPTFVKYKKSSIYFEGVKHEYSHPTRVSSNQQYFFAFTTVC